MYKLSIHRHAVLFFLLTSLLAPGTGLTQEPSSSTNAVSQDHWGYGLRVRAGGRYDNVRMCVASSAGFPGGPAMDVTGFMELGLSPELALVVDLPLLRPLLFGASFEMLQFEPEAGLLFRRPASANKSWIFGPTLGISFHYGPDYHSESSGEGRGPSFFAMGPRVGGYLGLSFERPGKSFDWEIGLHPFVTALFSVDDVEDHRGVVIGGTLDLQLRFGTR